MIVVYCIRVEGKLPINPKGQYHFGSVVNGYKDDDRCVLIRKQPPPPASIFDRLTFASVDNDNPPTGETNALFIIALCEI